MRRASRRTRRGGNARRAFSLLEVLVAMAIFFGALAVIGQLAGQGVRMARRTRLLSQAQLAAETKLAEAVIGLEPTDDLGGQLKPLGEPAGWLYAIERIESSTGQSGLRVRVRQDVPEDRSAVEVKLVRWLPGEQAAAATSSDAPPGAEP